MVSIAYVMVNYISNFKCVWEFVSIWGCAKAQDVVDCMYTSPYVSIKLIINELDPAAHGMFDDLYNSVAHGMFLYQHVVKSFVCFVYVYNLFQKF